MEISTQIAKHFREVFFGGNWTTSNVRDQLNGVTWQQATQPVNSLNTIATLFFHLNYYVGALAQVMEGGPLDASDKFAFIHPPITNENDWQQIMSNAWANAERFASLVEQMPGEKLWTELPGGKYGHYYRNLHGIIEHAHYHLGQIVLIKKILHDVEADTVSAGGLKI